MELLKDSFSGETEVNLLCYVHVWNTFGTKGQILEVRKMCPHKSKSKVVSMCHFAPHKRLVAPTRGRGVAEKAPNTNSLPSGLRLSFKKTDDNDVIGQTGELQFSGLFEMDSLKKFHHCHTFEYRSV